MPARGAYRLLSLMAQVILGFYRRRARRRLLTPVLPCILRWDYLARIADTMTKSHIKEYRLKPRRMRLQMH